MRRLWLMLPLIASISSCSVPKAESLSCGEDQSIFACQAVFSDGKARNIVFVKFPSPGQNVLDATTTRDDVGNLYCVTLYDNVTATYYPGECGTSPQAPTRFTEPTSTSVDPGATPQGVACTENTPVLDCRASYSDGTSRRIQFVETIPNEYVRLDTDPHIDDTGTTYCVSVYGLAENAVASYRIASPEDILKGC
jgi:hypothetical protein